ncbi:MAG: threonine synthase [Thermoprotei archaeon]|nr:MAG: threonine synthase [Thermoprotei archaeon]
MKCIRCGRDHDPRRAIYTCKSCGGLLDVAYDYTKLDPARLREEWRSGAPWVWKYHQLLPADPKIRVSLGEGGTGLHRCRRLAERLGVKELYVKNEGENPTGSFKDRGMTVGVTVALMLRARATACASTGNTSASLAAYSAKAGLPCLVIVPSSKIARGKLVQAIAHGARVLAIKGSFDDALREVRKLAESGEVYLLNSVNPFRLEGQKTLAYEVYEQLGGRAPSRVVLPVGNAGNISAIWKGFKELVELGMLDSPPKMMGVQAEGASPFASMLIQGLDELVPVREPETVASAIGIGFPVNWPKARRAVEESGGWVAVVSDQEIVEAQRMLARLEGLYVEPASAASIAGLARMLEERAIDRDEEVVCVATGHGLKDPDVVLQFYEEPVEVSVEEALEEARRVLR